MKRVVSIDVTRGLVMVIMAIDHIRDLMHTGSLNQDPMDFKTTHPALFFTRWITYLCAPTFVFLSGVSAYLSFKRKNNLAQSRKFLVTRGVWLILLEFTVITFALWWDIKFRMFLFQVIAAIGFGFIILAMMLKLKLRTILIAGLVIILTHDLLPFGVTSNTSPVLTALLPLFTLRIIPLSTTTTIIVAYPVIPWLGIMLCGFGAGKIFELDHATRMKYFSRLSVLCILLFIILRSINFYGDPSRWGQQKNAVFTFLSFMNVSKYPPSLQFALITLGIMFIILYFSEKFTNYFSKIFAVYGKVPMFYYLCHWYIIHPIMFIILFAEGFKTKDLFPSPSSFGRPVQPNGVTLPYIYLIWLAVVIILYPLCKWYGNYRSAHPEKKWLSYL